MDHSDEVKIRAEMLDLLDRAERLVEQARRIDGRVTMAAEENDDLVKAYRYFRTQLAGRLDPLVGKSPKSRQSYDKSGGDGSRRRTNDTGIGRGGRKKTDHPFGGERDAPLIPDRTYDTGIGSGGRKKSGGLLENDETAANPWDDRNDAGFIKGGHSHSRTNPTPPQTPDDAPPIGDGGHG